MNLIRREIIIHFTINLIYLGVILIIDNFTPNGYLDWFLYLPAIIYSSLTLPKKYTIYVTALSILFTIIGFFISPAGILFQLAAVNRFIGLLVLSMTAAFILHQNQEDDYKEEIENQLKIVLNKMNKGIVYLQLSDIIILTNRKFEKLLGYYPGELQRKNILDLVQSDSKIKYITVKEKLISNLLRSDYLDLNLIKKDGQTLHVNIALNIIQNNSGESSFLVAFVQETGDRKRKGLKNKIAVNEKLISLKDTPAKTNQT